MLSPLREWPAMQEQDVMVVWTQGAYHVVRVEYVEGLPKGVPLRQDLGAIATGATIAATLITGVQLQENQLLQLRYKPLDDVELRLWHQRGTAKFWIRNSHCQTSLLTGIADPQWTSTTFFTVSKDKDPYLEALNISGYNLAQCRIQMWGWRAITRDLDATWKVPDTARRVLFNEQKQATIYSPWNGRPVMWIAAEGRQG